MWHPTHLESAMERSSGGAGDMFLTAGIVAAACEGLDSGKEGSQFFPGSMALFFLEWDIRVILKWPCHILPSGGQLLVMPCPENFGFINHSCAVEHSCVVQHLHWWGRGWTCTCQGEAVCTWTRVRVLQHPQECPAGVQTGRVQPQAEMPCRHRGMYGYCSGEASSSRGRGGCPAGWDVAVAQGGNSALHPQMGRCMRGEGLCAALERCAVAVVQRGDMVGKCWGQGPPRLPPRLRRPGR